jgi:hypothetical protein
MVKEASCQNKEDCFFPSDKDIRKDVKAQQGHWETHQETMIMPWSTLGDIGIKAFRFGNEGVGGQWWCQAGWGGALRSTTEDVGKKTSLFWVVSKIC